MARVGGPRRRPCEGGHGLFLSGLVQEDGKIATVEVDQEYLQEVFADKVLLALHGEGLLTEEQVDNMKSWPHPGFNVFIGDPIPHTDKERLPSARAQAEGCFLPATFLRQAQDKTQMSGIQSVSRQVHFMLASNLGSARAETGERLSIVEKPGSDAIVEYAAYKDGVKSVRQFSPLQFLAEVSMHIPDTFEQMTRFFGAYSCRFRGAAKERENDPITAVPEPRGAAIGLVGSVHEKSL